MIEPWLLLAFLPQCLLFAAILGAGGLILNGVVGVLASALPGYSQRGPCGWRYWKGFMP